MTFKPAHKQDDPAKKPGQLHFDRHPYLKYNTTDQTLADYIARKESFNKLTFKDWIDEYYPSSERPDGFEEDWRYRMMQAAFKAGQENK